MSDDRKYQQGSGSGNLETRALKALRRLPSAEPGAEARAQARAAFLAGAKPSAADIQKPKQSRRIFMTSALGLMAAAIAAILIGRVPTEEWVVLDVLEPGGVTAPSGQVLSAGDRLVEGTLITAPGSEVELQLGERLRFRLQPGTQIELPKAPGRWLNRSRVLLLSSGEIYGTTGGQKLGFPMEFKTDELTAILTGTTFAVFRTDEASCVCLWEGGINVIPAAENRDTISLTEGRRVWVYRDNRAPEVLPLDAMEIMKLQMTDDQGIARPDSP